MQVNRIFGVGLAVTVALGVTGLAGAQKSPAKPKAAQTAVNPLKITRANLAKSASFVVTQTVAGTVIRKFIVEVNGEKARLDYDDDLFGPVRYVANEKGVFFYTPGNGTAVKQNFKGGVEGALKLAFAEANKRMARAQKVRTETVSGQPTVVYKDPETGTLIYVGTRPGFRLPVKTELVSSSGSKNTLLVTNIKLNVAIPDSRFKLPDGTKIIESKDAPGVGLPTIN